MTLRFVERRGVHVVTLLCLLAAVVVGCSSAPTETTATAAEAIGPTKCGPCEKLWCHVVILPHGGGTVEVCACLHEADGTACSDGNACDLAGTCSSGTCIPGGTVTCTAPDQCHVAACNASTGCEVSPAPDGTSCGTPGQVCFAGTCITPCGLMTCANQHMQCGQTGDGCGHIIDCGTCTAPETCGGGGVPSVCGAPKCTRQTCAQIGANCGEQADGCGGLINCGTCTAPQTCGGGGVPSVCGSEKCVPKTCANYPAGTCGQQADGCGGVTPDCSPCTAPETCGGAGVLDHCGFCGGDGYGPCPDGLCNPGAINDGLGHCVQCSSQFGTFSMTATSQQPNYGYWNVEFQYSIGLPSAPSFTALVSLSDGASGSMQTQRVTGPTGTASFWVPMLTTESAVMAASLTDANDPTCVMPTNPAETSVSWNDPAGVRGVTCPSTPPPTLSTNGGGSRGGPVTIVPLLWGFSDLAFSQELANVYGLIGSSNYYAWLTREYGAPQITSIPPISVPNVNTNGGSVSSQLADWIRANVPSEVVPVQGPIMFVVHLSPGTTVTIPSGTLCTGGLYAYNTKETSFNLLEGTFDYYYAVIPDPSTPCNGQPQLGFDAMTVSLSHELAENLTDPDGQTGWEARGCTSAAGPVQIGDICAGEVPVNATSTHVAAIANPLTPSNSVVVQKLWSNLLGACVTEDAPGVPFN
jgi:hypothetical protein